MDAKKTYESYAAAFEESVANDDWTRLAEYFSPDAIYVDSLGAEVQGRDQIVEHLKASVEALDKKFCSRELRISSLIAENTDLKHEWRIAYDDSLLAPLVLTGSTQASIVGSQIVSVIDQLSERSRIDIANWLDKNANMLDW